jgi:CheY-like chemotaxis protein
MMAARTSLMAHDLPDTLESIRAAIEQAVPHGRSVGRGKRDTGSLGDPPAAIVDAWATLAERFGHIVAKHPRLKNTNNLTHLGTLGTGSTFKIYLPATDHPAEERDRESVSAPEVGKETILLAEDDDMVRAVVVRILTAGGYRVLTSRDGAEAVRLFAEHARQVDLAILDVVMPELGGVEALARIQELRPDVPWLLTSGYSELSHLEGRDASPEKILPKPYDPNELLRRVRLELDD